MLGRVKQALMIVGLLTILGIVAMGALFVYLWFDTRHIEQEIDSDETADSAETTEAA